ncbi:EAL domain-containing protein [Auraticoccus cholistanensis]|uniref:EAL domain-containing protein n=1 Tax=Auraticoccus cholistanensis TaxID=2656650 RepID=UPI002F90F439
MSGTDRWLRERLFDRGELVVSQVPMVDLATGVSLAVRVLAHGAPEHGSVPPDEVRRLIAGADDPAALDLLAREQALAATETDPLLAGFPRVLDAELATLSELPVLAEGAPLTILLLDATTALERPAAMLRLIGTARSQGWQIGLREVGADHLSLAAVAVVEPALVVLSRRMLAEPSSGLSIETIQATTAYSSSSGAIVAAEQVDDPATAAAAHAAGVTLVTGRYSRPHPEVVAADAEVLFRLFTPPLPVPHQSPFELAARRATPRRADKELLLALSTRLEATAETGGRSGMVLSAFQHARHLPPGTVARYRRLGASCTMVLMAAQGAEKIADPAVSVAALDGSDPLVHEWNVLVLSPTVAAMLVARDTGHPSATERQRSFDYVLSYDRDLVAHAARSLLTRLTHRVTAVPPFVPPLPAGALGSESRQSDPELS